MLWPRLLLNWRLLGGLRLLELWLGLLLLWLLRQCRSGSSAESWTCATADVAAAGVKRPRKMIRQAKPARRNHDEKLGILKSMAL